jgi:uncharacterized protein YlzI (FlbEa/FlbD family)
MPIEIKELHIKAIVVDTSKEKKAKLPDIDIIKLKKEIVKQCVQEVMEKMKEKNERRCY